VISEHEQEQRLQEWRAYQDRIQRRRERHDDPWKSIVATLIGFALFAVWLIIIVHYIGGKS
jgi:hypothetical protein